VGNEISLFQLLLTARGQGTHDWNNEISFPTHTPTGHQNAPHISITNL